MIGLGEHVEGVDGFNLIAFVAEAFEVAGEGAGVATNIYYVLGCEVGERVERFYVQTRAGWVEQNQVGRFRPEQGQQAGQDVLNRAFVQADVVEGIQVVGKVVTSRWGGFNGDELADRRCQKRAEQTCPAVEFQHFVGRDTFCQADDVLHKFFTDGIVNLKKRTRRERKVFLQDAIVQLVGAGEMMIILFSVHVAGGDFKLHGEFGGQGVFTFKEHKAFAVVVFAEGDAFDATFGVKVDGLQQGVEPGHGNLAMFDGEDAGVVGTHKAKFAIRGDMALNLVAIVPALAALGDVAECLGIDASNATELVANGIEFGFKLLLVGHVLIVATATNREIFTLRGNAMG